MHMQMPNQQMDQLPPHGPPHQSWGPPQGVPPHSYGGPGYAHNPQYMPPPRQLDNFYPSADMPLPMEKQPHQGISAYGRKAPVNVPSAAQSAPSMVTQVTKQMQIPLSYADAVIGTAGASISYIRRASRATVTIQESRGAPGEMTVEISGTASHVQAAEQLIQVKPKQKLDEKLKEKERSEEELVAPEDSTFVEVMGEDYPGRVRGMGKGPTPSYYASTSRSHAAHVKSIKVQQLQSEVQEMRREMKEKDDRVENLEKQVKEKDDRLEKLDPITTIVIHNYLEFLHV